MNLKLGHDPVFVRDLETQFEWYEANARPGISDRFLREVYLTLQDLLNQPGLGRRRKFRDPRLADFQSWAVREPFGRIIVFYRIEGALLVAERLMHGARNLRRRLLEDPST